VERTREGTFRDTVLTNVQEVAALLPAFNLTADPAYQAIADRVSALARSTTVEELRAQRSARDKARQRASDLLDCLAGFKESVKTVV